MARIDRLEVVSVDAIVPDPDNPNVEPPNTFNQLVEAIKETGMLDPPEVVEKDGHYVLTAGEHRWKAAKLAGLTEIPVIVIEDMDDDERQMHMVRSNALKGRIDPKKFTKLYERLEAKYGEQAVREKMGLKSDSDFKKLYRQMAKSVGATPSKQDEDKIESLDDLALVLNSLFSRYGSTLDQHFMFFTFGGKMHLMVQMDEDRWTQIKAFMDDVTANGQDAPTAILEALQPPTNG